MVVGPVAGSRSTGLIHKAMSNAASMRHVISALALLSAVAAAPAPDPVLRQLVADAKADKPVAFERTQRVEDTGKKAIVYVDRYNPALADPWKLVSVDGRAPKSDEMGDWRKTLRNGVPSYGRVALLLGGAARVDANHYHIAHLPKGFVPRDSFGEHLLADVVVDTSTSRPFVREARFYAAGPFRMFIIAKIEKFDATNHYAPGPDGVMRIVAQDTVLSGSGPGMSGTEIKHVTFTPIAR